jgi:hypothetical protein
MQIASDVQVMYSNDRPRHARFGNLADISFV